MSETPMEKVYDNVCPVCGKHFKGYYFEYEICPRCGWEDDPIQVECPDMAGANGPVTFRQAVINYEKTGRAKPDR